MPVEELLERFRGSRFAIFAESLIADYSVMSVEAFTQAFRIRSVELFAKELRPMNGAIELVSAHHHRKMRGSNGPRDKIETCLGVTGLLPHFESRIACAYEVGSWKPEPGLILHAAQMMGVPTKRCLLVEGSLAGVQAGLAAGVQVVGYRLSESSQAALHRRVPVIQELSKLRSMIG